MSKIPLKFRAACEDDIPIIFNSWLRCYRSSDAAKTINSTSYFTEQHKICEDLLSTSHVLIACSPTDPTEIYGYVVAERVDGLMCIHFAYVKVSFRKFGIFKLMCSQLQLKDGETVLYTHQTFAALRMGLKYGAIYHPYLAYVESYRKKARDLSGALRDKKVPGLLNQRALVRARHISEIGPVEQVRKETKGQSGEESDEV